MRTNKQTLSDTIFTRKATLQKSVLVPLIAAVLMSPLAHSDWRIADDSLVGFVSIKNNSIAENNHFTGVSGSLSDEGAIVASIDLTTVETKVQIRNQRLMQLLFKVANYPEAQISGQLEGLDVAQLAAGATVERELPLTVSIHGSQATISAVLLAVSVPEGVRVTTAEPIILNARDFGLEPGIAALQAVAGLDAISRAVPVTIDLLLTKD